MVEATSQKAICFKHDAKISIFSYNCKRFSVYLYSFDEFYITYPYGKYHKGFLQVSLRHHL